MTAFLAFTIYAPLSSWGDIAVGESRGAWDRPSRSAVLGLVAAALGIERGSQEAHDALDRGYRLAVRLDAPGTPLVDYHTAQTVAASALRKKKPHTRAELLDAVPAGDRETILSRRAYRQDALATVLLWPAADNPRWSLEQMESALRRPHFALYAGRKASPFGLPLGPQVLEADSLAECFARYCEHRGRNTTAPASVDAALDAMLRLLRPDTGWGREVSRDADLAGVAPGFETRRREVRRDASPQRTRWQFVERTVEVGEMTTESNPTVGDRNAKS